MKRILCLFSIMIMGFSVFAQDLFSDAGFTLKEQRTNRGMAEYVIESEAGIEMVMTGTVQPNEDIMMRVNRVASLFSQFSVIPIEAISIILKPDLIEIRTSIEAFSYKEDSISNYLPAGMLFYYTDYMEYDIAMVVQKFRLRVEGQFFSDMELVDKLYSISKNPGQFLNAQDPEFVASQLIQFEESFVAVNEKVDTVSADLVSSAEEAASERSALEASLSEAIAKVTADLKSESEIRKSADSDLSDNLSSLEEQLAAEASTRETKDTEFEEKLNSSESGMQTYTEEQVALLTGMIEDLQAQIEALDSKVEVYRFGAMMWLNRKKPIEQDLIDQIVEWKEEDSSITWKEMKTKAKENGLSVSSTIMKIIYVYYFNEYQ